MKVQSSTLGLQLAQREGGREGAHSVLLSVGVAYRREAISFPVRSREHIIRVVLISVLVAYY